MGVDPFLEQLKKLCRQFPTRSKWVFVPTHAIGHTLGERLVLEGTNWLNVRFVTPLDIALRMGAPFLVERGIDPSEEDLGPALMMRLLMELPPGKGYFRPLANHPTLAQALWSTVRELRMAGVGPAQIAAAAFDSPLKHAEIVALLGSYESFLELHRRADMATVYEEAVHHMDWCPIQPQDCWTDLPDANWNPLQRRLLDVLPGERITPRAFTLPGIEVPRRLRAARIERLDADPASSPLALVMAPPAGWQFIDRIELFHAGGREAEIEEVFRRILTSGHRSTRSRSPARPMRMSHSSGRNRSATIGRSRSAPEFGRRSPGPDARSSACATGSRPTSRPVTSGGCSSPAICESRNTKASRPARPAGSSRVPKPVGDAEPIS